MRSIKARMYRCLVRSGAAALLTGLAISLAVLTSAPVSAFREPAPGSTGPAQSALLVAGGREVVLVGPPGQVACQGSSARLQIRATVSQTSTGAFGEGTLDLPCPQANQPGDGLTVDAASGGPAFSDGIAQTSLVYQSEKSQWLGELTLVDQLPSDNPLATSFRDRMGAPWWVVIVLSVVSGLLLLATAGLLIRGRRRAGAAA